MAKQTKSTAKSTGPIVLRCRTVESAASDPTNADDRYGSGAQDVEDTEFADAQLRLNPDGTFAIACANDDPFVTGTWRARGDALAIKVKQVSGYEAADISVRDGVWYVELTLVDDAHDGNDLLRLEFAAEATAKAKGARGAKAKGKSFNWSALDRLEEWERFDRVKKDFGKPATAARAIWDAFAAGELTHDETALHLLTRVTEHATGAELVAMIEAFPDGIEECESTSDCHGALNATKPDDVPVVAAAIAKAPSWLALCADQFAWGADEENAALYQALRELPAFAKACASRAIASEWNNVAVLDFCAGEDALRALENTTIPGRFQRMRDTAKTLDRGVEVVTSLMAAVKYPAENYLMLAYALREIGGKPDQAKVESAFKSMYQFSNLGPDEKAAYTSIGVGSFE